MLVAAIVSVWLVFTAPVQVSEDDKRSAKIVQTISPKAETYPISVTAYGTVIPSRQVIIRPEVSGRIVSQNTSLIPGGRIEEGEKLFTIDDSDYRIALQEAEAALTEARSESEIEDGRQTIAKRELEQLRKDLPDAAINQALVLREPFKASADALLQRAGAAVDRAKLNLTRTSPIAPFNAVVIDESVENGQFADPSSPLATLIGTDAFWIQASIPLTDLKWIKLPTDETPGASVKIDFPNNSEPNSSWSGKVIRLLGDLEAEGRMARVLIEVPKPLDSNPDQPLLLGSYVRIQIDAGTLDNTIKIPRVALREGDRVWLASADKTLVIRDANILWKHENTILISNPIGEGETLIISSLNAPLPGMEIAPEPVNNYPLD